VHSLRGVTLRRLLKAVDGRASFAQSHVEIPDPVVDTEINCLRAEIQRPPVQIDRPFPVGSLFRASRVVLQFLKICHYRAWLVLIIRNPGINSVAGNTNWSLDTDQELGQQLVGFSRFLQR